MQKQWVNCNLCGANNTRLLLVKDSFRIVKCTNCGLVYVNPIPMEVDYNDSYFLSSNAAKRGCNNYIREKNSRIVDFRKRLNKVQDMVQGGKLLEIGCAAGFFLELAASEGFDVVGTDVSEFTSAYAREKLGLNVLTGNLRDKNFPAGSFDVVVMWHVIEHLMDPTAELLEINRIMKEGGLLFVECPNVASLNHRLVSRITRNFDVAFKLPEHIYYFSPNTLQTLFRKTGFQIIKMETNNIRGSLETIRCVSKGKLFSKQYQYDAVTLSVRQNPLLFTKKKMRALVRGVVRALNVGDNIEAVAKKN